MDWPRFWGQFSETVDKTNVAAITKFLSLSELLDSKVKKTVEALPFTSEGYNCAKNILQEKFGKESEIVKARKFAIGRKTLHWIGFVYFYNCGP